MYFEDWITEEMWCEDCNGVVEAEVTFDPDTGYKDVYCPMNKSHDLVDIKNCENEGCDEKIPVTEHFCEWCMQDLKLAAKAFENALPHGMDVDQAYGYVIDYMR